MRRTTVLAISLCLAALPACGAALQACADQAETPPFSYAARVNGHKGGAVVGASVDLLRLIVARHGWQLEVQLLPWARCLALVADHRVAVALNSSKTDAQASGLRVSKTYFTLHHVYFYSRRARPRGLTLAHLGDVRQYHLCGLGGYRFEAFGIDTASVDRGATAGYEQLIAKLHLGRCDLFIDSRENMAGQYLINPTLRALLVDGTLVGQPLPDLPTRALYFAVASQDAAATLLLTQLNQGLDELDKTHEMDKLLSHYLE
ncbi:substrate-binding periplasmic protein [Rugamonas sp. CCM 8940]|uniref:substrate-binding periplasmic protein n=1 Tax=Rugamonas sp. CCM 8940 TaxID=2765359 RepID=UPI0018F66E4E|nr:transporter substrate-binding domain-containing protein [Rugamonas sp. CCM 8940]MBJ7312733.1 transporter substrate-binding domain-containing protein [Rugamonas sp. CCM 8940]